MVDEKGPDDKLVCVPLRDPMWSEVVGDRGEAFRVLAEARARSAAPETGRR
jgi:inorganic pyrophosphatase